MSQLLESLGRGLLLRVRDVFHQQLTVSESRRVLAERAAACPTSLDAQCQAGAAALHADDLGAAQAAFRAAESIAPHSNRVLIGLACVQDELGQLGAATPLVERIAEQDPDDPAAAFAAGLCHERRRDVCSAGTWYGSAIERCPTLRNAYERRAAIAIRRGDWERAQAEYRQLAQLDPGDLDVLMLRGAIELRAGEPQAAVASFQQGLLIEPEHDEGLLDDDACDNGAQLCRRTRETEELVARYPGASEFRVQLGDLYARQGEDELAIEQYEVALDLQPTFLEASVKLGTQHMRSDRFLEAARSFNLAGELNDRLVIAFVGLGLAQQACGDALDAEATFDLAASLAPNSVLLTAEATRLRFRAAEVPGEGSELLEEACRRLEQLRRRRPQDAGLHYRLATLRKYLGEHGTARRHLATAVHLQPTLCKAVVQHAVALRSRDEDAAQQMLEQTLRLHEDTIALHYDLGLVFAQPIRFEVSLEALRRESGSHADAAEETLLQSLQNIGLLDRCAGNWRQLNELVATPDRVSSRV